MPRTFAIVLKSASENRETPIDGHDDLRDDLKKTIAEYVTDLTSKNEFPIAPGNNTFSFRSVKGGLPAPIDKADANGQKTFLTENLDENGKNKFEGTSNSRIHSFTLVKGKLRKSEPDSYTQIELLNDVNTKGGQSAVALSAEKAASENNGGYRQDAQYTNTEGKFKNDRDLRLGSTQFRQPGVYSRRKYPTAVSDTSIATDSTLTISDLTKMGTLLLLEASGESAIPDPNDPAFEVLGELQSTAPAIARTFGARIEASRFAPSNVMKRIKKGYVVTDNTAFLDGQSALSWGNTNNPLVPFDGLTALPSITSATLLIATVTTTLLGLSLLISGIKTQGHDMATNQAPADRKRFLGSWRGKEPGADVAKVLNLNIVPVTHDAAVVLRKGIEAFFGQGTSSATAGEAARNVAVGIGTTVPQIHGYYNTVLRTITRSLVALGYPISDVVSNPNASSGDVRQAADPVSLIKKLNSSPLLAFINILLTIGEKALLAEEHKILYGGDTDSSSDVNSSVDSIPETITEAADVLGNGEQTLLNPAVLIAKNRLTSRGFEGRLSMANSTTRSLFYIPKNLGVDLGEAAGKVSDAKASVRKYNTVVASPGRIDSITAKAMEDHLESDYMPFYFQDLRTNEILSFHAFLEGISEDVSADYTETEGFGRLGKVYTYKNTHRNIGFSFTLVATNDDDFDLMWYKINRLGMMLYPQWSEGRRVTFEGKSFVQPFSQVISASPMVRVRLGDLWKSNYNKVSVARLFGVGTSAFNLSAQTRPPRPPTQEEEGEDLNRRIQALLTASPTTYQVGEKVLLAAPLGGYRKEPPGEGFSPVPPMVAEIVRSVANSTQFVVKVPPYPNVRVPSSHLRRIESEVRRRELAGRPVPTTTPGEFDAQSATQEFFNPDNNPILRSFESAMGKGIAGFFKSMRMDYEQARWATDKLNGRAPMLVKISMEFALIHDLQPGLSSDGFMSAPIWNVGNIMKNLTGDPTREDTFNANKQALYSRNSTRAQDQASNTAGINSRGTNR